MAKPFYSSYNEKAMLVAVIALLAISLLMLFFHFYAKWHFRLPRPRSQSVDSITEDPFPAIEDEETSGGLDPSLLAELPIFMYKAGECNNRLACVVCLNALEDEEKCRILPKCRHCFHVGCVDKWLLSHSSCPLCRAPVGPVEHVLVVTREGIGGSTPRMSEAVGEDDYGEHQNSSVEIVVEIDPPDLVAISSSSSSSLCSLKRMLSRSRSESKVYPTSPVDS